MIHDTKVLLFIEMTKKKVSHLLTKWRMYNYWGKIAYLGVKNLFICIFFCIFAA